MAAVAQAADFDYRISSHRIERFKSITRATMKEPVNYIMLESELEINTILPKLLQHEAISYGERGIITQHIKRRRKIGELLDIFFHRNNDQWIDKFLLSLEQSNQNHIILRLKGLAPTPLQYHIRQFRQTHIQERVLLREEDDEDAIRRSYDSQKLSIAREVLNCDIITVYKGSLCFLLAGRTNDAVEDLWNKKRNAHKMQKFLKFILNQCSSKKNFTNRRIVTVEITEKPNEFLFRLGDTSKCITRKDTVNSVCSDCFRRTVLYNYENIVDEIETMMIEQTFSGKDKRVPGCILKACLHEKDVRSRQERADIFLRYILTDEEHLLSFRNVFLRNVNLTLNTVLCETHKGQTVKTKLRKQIVLHFEVHYDRSVDTIFVTQVSEGMEKIMKYIRHDSFPEKTPEILKILEGIDDNRDKDVSVAYNKESNNYVRLVVFLVDTASSTLRNYFQVKVLHGKSFQNYLNEHKHTLFHLFSQIQCCSCTREIQNQQRQWSANQFWSMFENVKDVQHKFSFCICRFSAKRGVSTSILDITSMKILIHNCESNINDEDSQMIKAIADVRNKLAVMAVEKGLSTSIFNSEWDTLERSILGLASKIDVQYKNAVMADINYLRHRTLLNDDALKTYQLMQDWLSDKYSKTEIIKPEQETTIMAVQGVNAPMKKNVEACTELLLKDIELNDVIEDIRIILIGRDVCGKDLLYNTLLNEYGFYTGGNEEQIKRGVYFDAPFRKQFIVTCAPSKMFEFQCTLHVQRLMEKCIASTSPGPHAIILTIHQTQMIKEECLDEILNTFVIKFGSEIKKFFILSIIGCTNYPRETLITLLRQSPLAQELVISNRFLSVGYENRNCLVSMLLRLVDETGTWNTQAFFTNQIYQKVEEDIKRDSFMLQQSLLEEYRQIEYDVSKLKAMIIPREIQQKKLENSNTRELVIRSYLQSDTSP